MAEDYGAFVNSPVASDTGYARMMRRYTTDGVVQDGPDAGGQLTVTGNATSELTIAAGYAIVGGWFYRTDTPVTIPVSPNGSSSPRRDLVVIRADTTVGECFPHIITGTPGGTWPTPTRNPNGVWDTVLARTTVQGGSAVVTPADVDTSVREWTVPAGAVPCASTARPSSPFEGMLISETDTNRVLVRVGGTWRTVAETEYPTSWQELPLRAGYEHPGHGGRPQWRWVRPGTVELRGTISRSNGAGIPTATYIARLPTAARPGANRRYVGASAAHTTGAWVRMEVRSTSQGVNSTNAGRIFVYTDGSHSPIWVSLDGWQYDIT